MQKTNDKTDSIIAVVLALLVYIPGSSIGNILRLGVVVVVFVMKHMNEHAEPGIRKVALFMVLSPLLSVLFVVIIEGFGVNWDLVIHEIQRMLFCAFLLMTVAKLHISFRMIYIIAIIVLLPNFMIQLLQRANVNAVFTFLKKYYQSGVADDQWTHLDLAKEQGGGFRSGSIFINPNVYMAIPLMALVVFLQQDKEKSSIWNYVLIGCAVFSAFLTGSRTALIVIAVMMVWYIVKYAGTGSKIFMIIAIVFVLYEFGAFIFSSRSAQVFETGSFDVKINSFRWFWDSTKEVFIYWFTGAIGSKIANMVFDGEIGHLYGWFGLFGVYWYILYYRSAWKCNRDFKFYTLPLIAVHIFVAITSSVLMNMHIYPFVAVLIFSHLKPIAEHKEIVGDLK